MTAQSASTEYVSKTKRGRWLRCVSAVQNVEQSFTVMLPSIGTRLEHQLCPESQTSVSTQCSAVQLLCGALIPTWGMLPLMMHGRFALTGSHFY